MIFVAGMSHFCGPSAAKPAWENLPRSLKFLFVERFLRRLAMLRMKRAGGL